jgi:hypothetical protein
MTLMFAFLITIILTWHSTYAIHRTRENPSKTLKNKLKIAKAGAAFDNCVSFVPTAEKLKPWKASLCRLQQAEKVGITSTTHFRQITVRQSMEKFAI